MSSLPCRFGERNTNDEENVLYTYSLKLSQILTAQCVKELPWIEQYKKYLHINKQIKWNNKSKTKYLCPKTIKMKKRIVLSGIMDEKQSNAIVLHSFKIQIWSNAIVISSFLFIYSYIKIFMPYGITKVHHKFWYEC